MASKLASKTKEHKVQERIDAPHHRYRIIAARQGEKCRAIAYLGMRSIETRDGETVEAAIDSLREVLDQRIEQLRAERVEGVPSEAEYGEALGALFAAFPERSLALLTVLGRLPEGATTLSGLARHAGREEAAVATDAARIGRKLGALLGFAPEAGEVRRALIPTLTFAEVVVPAGGTAEVLRLRPEILGPLRAMDKGDGLVR